MTAFQRQRHQRWTRVRSLPHAPHFEILRAAPERIDTTSAKPAEKDNGITVLEFQTKEIKTKRCVFTVKEAGQEFCAGLRQYASRLITVG